MGGEWLKIRADLDSDPKVLAIASHLSRRPEFIAWWLAGTRLTPMPDSVVAITDAVNRAALVAATVGFLMRVWRAANEHTEDGFFPLLSLKAIDDLACVPGIGAAMASVGWAVESTDPQGVRLPRFERYNLPFGQRAAPLTGAQRQARYRERLARDAEVTGALRAGDENVTGALRSGDERVTKRHPLSPITPIPQREELNTPPLPPRGGGARAVLPAKKLPDGFAAFWAAYPNKVAKGRAVKAWLKLAPDAALQAAILLALGRHKRGESWLRDGGRYIPYPATWLNDRRWEDEAGGVPDAAGPGGDLGDTIRQTRDSARRRRETLANHEAARIAGGLFNLPREGKPA